MFSDSVNNFFKKGQDGIEIVEMTAERKLESICQPSMRFNLSLICRLKNQIAGQPVIPDILLKIA